MRLADYWRRLKDMWVFHSALGGVIVQEDSRKLNVYYKESSPLTKNVSTKKSIIFMVDGRTQSGGLCDRFRGLISTYKWAEMHGYDFKVHYVSPIKLEDYLLPNKYDWEISEEDISYNSNYSKPIHIHSESNNFERCFFNRMLDKQIEGKYQQYHVYTNLLAVDRTYFSDTFKKLFKPSTDLERAISYHKEKVEGDYIACSFRFLQLLGDFKDCVGTPLTESKRKLLIDKCIAQLYVLHKANDDKKVLVVSDSETFVKTASSLRFVYTIPGRIVHMDYSDEDTYDLHLKTFVDFFMISGASKVYLMVSGGMYPESAFAKFASWIGNKAFEIIRF